MAYNSVAAAAIAVCVAALMAGECAAAQPAIVTDSGKSTYPAAYFADQRPSTAWDMIGRLPGFTFERGDQVRGFSGAAGNVVIDGERPTSKGDDLVSILQRIPASQVDHIDVIRGGAPGIDMQGKSVLANVVRKASRGLHGEIVFGGNVVEDGRDLPVAKVDGSWERGAMRVEAGVQVARFVDDGSSSGRRYKYDSSGQVLDYAHMDAQAGGWQNNATGSLETPLAGGKFKINLFIQDQPYRARLAENFTHAGPDSEVDAYNQTDGEVGLHWERGLGHNLSIELIGLQHGRLSDTTSLYAAPGDDELFKLNSTSQESIARSVLHWTPLTDLTVEGGGEYAINILHSRTAYVINGVDQALPAANVRVREDRAEPFITATYKPLETVSVETGLKVEHSTLTSTGDVQLSKTLTYYKPRLLVSWSATKNDQLRLRLEREVGQLDFSQFVATSSLSTTGVQAGNPDLAPQKDWAGEVAWEHHFWGKGAFTLTARRLQLEDVVDRRPVFDPGCSDVPGQPLYRPDCSAGGQPPSVYDEPANIGGGVQQELIASLTLPLDKLHISGGLLSGTGTWRRAEVTDPTTGRKRPISGLPMGVYQLNFSQDVPAMSLNWGMGLNARTGATDYRYNEIDTLRNGAWASIWAEYKPTAGTSVRLSLENVGRRPFQITRVIYSGPRNLNPAPSSIDYQRHEFGLEFGLRVRHAFG